MSEYFPRPSSDCPTFDGDSEWHPIVDGAAYFAELDERLDELGPGDEVLVAGLGLDTDLDLRGTAAGAPGHRGLLDRLVALGTSGVDVRLLLAGKASAFLLPPLSDFRENVETCHRFNAAADALAGHALVDYSGPLLGSNHQKSVVVTRSGEVTAYVGGIDLEGQRLDETPHTRLRLSGHRWGWHDTAVRLRGPAAARAHDVLLRRWHEAATLPPRLWSGGHGPVNPDAAPTPPVATDQKPVAADQTSVRVLRSISDRKLGSALPWRRRRWDALPHHGVQEIFETLTTAIAAARRYVYLEDQYLYEYVGGVRGYELWPYLRDAAARGVKVILVGSGTRDPDDPGVNLRPINRHPNRDLRRKILDRLTPERRGNVAVHRVEHVTMHSKLTMVDDVFANIGSANAFSRSMAGVDCEISAAVETATTLVRDLRVRVWAEHLRAPLTPELADELGDLDLALGIWDPAWLPADRPATSWRVSGEPASFHPNEHVLARVD